MSFKGEQITTLDTPFISCLLHFFPLTFLFSPCSLFAADLQVKRLTSARRPLTHWVFCQSAQRAANLLYLILPFLHTQSPFSTLSAFSFLSFPPLWYSPFPIPPSALLFSVLLSGAIDFSKGWLQLP